MYGKMNTNHLLKKRVMNKQTKAKGRIKPIDRNYVFATNGNTVMAKE